MREHPKHLVIKKKVKDWKLSSKIVNDLYDEAKTIFYSYSKQSDLIKNLAAETYADLEELIYHSKELALAENSAAAMNVWRQAIVAKFELFYVEDKESKVQTINALWRYNKSDTGT
jgi:hypothetical protein